MTYQLVYSNLTKLGCLSLVVINLITLWIQVGISIQLGLSSVTCVLIGAVLSCKIQQVRKQDMKMLKRMDPEDTDEVMTQKDAAMFPLYGSAVLFSLYLLSKYFNKDILSTLLSVYFTFLGQLCLINLLETHFTPTIFQPLKNKYLIHKNIKFPFINDIVKFEITQLRLITFIISLVPSAFYFITKNYLLNNLFGIIFSITGIEQLVLPNFKVGFILLWGLFFYDIFWVYGTDVMVTVAKNIDAPIKLLFPLDLLNDPTKFSMLGLGDIVIPGIFVALCLKYDIDRNTKLNVSNIQTPYFIFCFIGYIVGILTTFAVMILWNHPQPALLFLVPSCTFSAFFCAVILGDVKGFFSWEENAIREKHLKQQNKTDK